jgi:hypothetical protein
MRSLSSRCVFSRRRTSTRQTFCTSCQFIYAQTLILLLTKMETSADLEITVPLLVQIDKLVQLIESPVFTCKLSSAPQVFI